MKVSTSRRWPRLLLAAVGIALAVWALTEWVNWREVRDWMQQLNPALLIVLLAMLPLFGFSISVVYLVTGAVFGGPMGVVVVAGITAVHLLAGHWLGRGFLRGPLLRWLERRKHKVPTVPPGENAAVALMTALVPGLPYFVRNYVLAVSDIPLRVYFWICWPVYVARSCLVLFLGDFSTDFSGRRAVILGGVFVLKVGICALILHRLRRRLHVPKAGRATPAGRKRLARTGHAE